MKVFQIGAAGGVGRGLARLLTARGDQVTGMHRGPAQAETVRAAGATPLTGDLINDSVDELAHKINGHDAVVFSAGAHGTGMDKTTAIDGRGLEKAADAATRAGASRFVLVSAFPESGRGPGTTEAYEHYMRVKKTADIYLTRTGLDWLIVRPGRLLDEPGTGRVTAGLAVEYGGVPRDDVAAFINAALHEPYLNRVIVELTAGETPIADAVAHATRRPASLVGVCSVSTAFLTLPPPCTPPKGKSFIQGGEHPGEKSLPPTRVASGARLPGTTRCIERVCVCLPNLPSQMFLPPPSSRRRRAGRSSRPPSPSGVWPWRAAWSRHRPCSSLRRRPQPRCRPAVVSR